MMGGAFQAKGLMWALIGLIIVGLLIALGAVRCDVCDKEGVQ